MVKIFKKLIQKYFNTAIPLTPNIEFPIKGELYSIERLEEYATFLGIQLKGSDKSKVTKLLLPRMRDNRKKLLAAYRALILGINNKDTISPAGIWLTDNFHIVEDQLREIEQDLPPSYYKELPKIALGELAGYPRIYAVALALVAHTDSQLDPETIRRFTQTYQKSCPLGIGELWALPITLRLVLVENLRRTALRIVMDHEKTEMANLIADQLFEVSGDKIKFQSLVLKLSTPCNSIIEEDCAYLAQIAKRLRDQEPELWPAVEHLEALLTKQNTTIEQVVNLSHQRQASYQVTVANIITSMRLLSSLDWRDFFESISVVDRILEQDSVYRHMDFLTRDQYRHVIEKIGKRKGYLEKKVAEEVVKLSKNALLTSPDKPKYSHVGYYLIDKGIKQLEETFQYKSKLRSLVFSLVPPNFIFFGLLAVLFIIICLFPIYYSITQGVSLPFLVVIFLLIFIPCSELTLNLTNLILTHLIKPKTMPKLDLKSGIPLDAKTMVVIPCLLTDLKVIQELIEKIEIHYLGNEENHLYFALLTDFTDGTMEVMPKDAELIENALKGIEKLNKKYSKANDSKFFLFHRHRQWNVTENTWMGWERKRGKIHEFNRLLRGDHQTSFSLVTAPVSILPTFKYIITLDADTQLPRDSARKLIGTILHPLNKAYLDKNLGFVTEGYSILQPRIGVSLESSSKSYFAKIFSGYTGIDPYTTAVSDVYQDLFHEGSYTGKGLYDIDCFEAALANRAPENTILSHDLFEGLYCRTALVSDVEFLDDYPQKYHTFFTRLHRWTRGDWQIGAWVFPFVKNRNQQWVPNQLPLISKWKIFDNLRRSQVMPFTFLWFIMTWTVFPGNPSFWISYILFLILFTSMVQLFLETFTSVFGKRNFRVSDTSIKTRDKFTPIIFHIIFLAHLAYIQTDAILRVFYRKLISKRQFLEWTTAAQIEAQTLKVRSSFWQTYWPIEMILIGIAVFIFFFHSQQFSSAIVLILIWMCYPIVANLLSHKLMRLNKILSTEDQLLLRQIARRTWHYFETFVGHGDHWLPPDNHQEFPSAVTAHRTSPTNIGLYILSLVSARDFGYINTSSFVTRLRLTLESMKKMELFNGHYLNWYSTETLQALEPKYVSTVDSGNLAGYLLAGRQSCLEIKNNSLINPKTIDGIRDTIHVLESEFKETKVTSHNFLSQIKHCNEILAMNSPKTLTEWSTYLNEIVITSERIKSNILKIQFSNPEKDITNTLKWLKNLLLQLHTAQHDIVETCPWISKEFIQLNSFIVELTPSYALKWKDSIDLLDKNSSLFSRIQAYDNAILLTQDILKIIKNSTSRLSTNATSVQTTLTLFIERLEKGKNFILRLLVEAKSAAEFMDQTFKQMDFNFLLDKNREVFSIGYRVSDGVLDNGLYDLLGSESRLASFIAIAKGDVPQEHWFRLGRQLVPVTGDRALVSWTASMFEYLMPLLVLRDYENTLLYETTHTIVSRQISYGKENNVPWGVSESGYNARDLQLNYQYGPFGIPGLGLKRGLSHDLVISPYSTLLAAMVDPVSAVENVKRLVRSQLLKNYGFYESIDFTSDRLPQNEKFAVIQSFMAHHQGMSLVAINNVINNNLMQDRFHHDPRVHTTRLLLQEKIPERVTTVPPKAAEIELESKLQPAINYFARHHSNPNSEVPNIQLLSNQEYSIMITSAGGGYSKCKGLAVTRWKEDATRDNWGSYIFVRDHLQDSLWSTSYQPLAQFSESYKVTFGEDKVEFRRRDGAISTYTEILVAPEDNVEIRHVTFTNHSDLERVLEVTSYLEPVLSPGANDLDHPAFSKLFIQTEFLQSKNALLAHRRKRSENDTEVWGLHVAVTDAKVISDLQYETDRAKFIGRGQSLQQAVALSSRAKLSNSIGATLDPILSLRITLKLPALGKAHVSFTTGIAHSREEALALADRYHDIHSFDRESKIAWTKSQVDMRHLNIDSKTSYLCQRIAERILFSETSLRPPSHIRATTTNIQSSLWPSGISGDLPIAVVMVGHLKDIPNIRSLLRCHEYLRLRGLIYDFVIINNHESTYYQELQEELQRQILSTGSQGWLNKNGGIFILRKDITPEKDIAHIKAVARILLVANEPLKDQLRRKALTENYPKLLNYDTKQKRDRQPSESNSVPKLDLEFFNSLGGFSQNGKEYVIQLRAGEWTPAPWINVVGNQLGFGFQISESGSGFTWFLNSQTNRLTPWSNDPVCDPSGEIIYLRDDETGDIWTPTPLPIRGPSTYTIRHGQGYSIFEHSDFGIQQTLTVFVPNDKTIKISILKLKNLTKKKRKISVTSYTEWVLGTQKEKTSPYLVCDADQKSSAIFASNPHDNEFATQVAFADISSKNRTFTCSRKEFLGRNGSYLRPAALLRNGLSRRRGTGQDPCAVLQTSFEIGPGEEQEMTLLLGQCENIESARELSLQFRDIKLAKAALEEVTQDWSTFNNIIQIQTPDPAMNILMNHWLLYQTLSCRYWSRTAFYQSGGAYGFRDQLQDSMAFVYANPSLTREHILRASERQFIEGDVQHWWHPPFGRGIRTRMSDDLLWLPFVVCFYINKTGDKTVLNEKTNFLEAPLLKQEEEDSYGLPRVSQEFGTIFEHCLRAINHSLSLGEHGLPLIGTGDWNDGMNRVGSRGKGESIWLGWFLYKVITDFLPFLNQPEHASIRESYEIHITNLNVALEKNGWDGAWYRRAYFDDGTPLGSAENDECKIDSISQTWSILSGAGQSDRALQSMSNAMKLLVNKKSNLILLLTPPFDNSPNDPGYIKGYVPGVRENGGQYTHAAIWMIMAYAKLGDGNTAFELFRMLNPILHSSNKSESEKYKVEPYVLAGDVYAGNSYEGRGGWSWYTGSAAWYYRAGLESILGFQIHDNKIKINPCIPSHWKNYEFTYNYKSTKFIIRVNNPLELSSGAVSLEVDGVQMQSSELDLVNDGENHFITATLQTPKL